MNNKDLMNSIMITKRVETVANGMLIQTAIRRLTDSYFHTTEGYKKVNICVAVTIVESKYGKLECICGTTPMDGRMIALKIQKENIHFEDILTFVELNRNDKAIDMSAEIYLKKEREKKCPELKQIELIKKQRDRQAIKSKTIETQNAVIKCMQLI